MASFPRALASTFTADKGVNAASRLVNDDFNWIFRRVPGESDYGIDAYFEIVTPSGEVTGQSIAAQIKTGPSFFKTSTPSSYIFYGEKKHINYYANLPQPVIIIIYDPTVAEGHWVAFDLNKIERTSSGWKIHVPKKNRLDTAAKDHLLKLVGPPKDHTNTLAEQWAINDMIGSGSYLMYMVDKEEILSQDVGPLTEFIQRITVNETLERAIRGKVLISISGYDDDPRELFEIPEVRRWFLKYTRLKFPWFYLLETVHSGHWLKLDFVIHARGARMGDAVSGIINLEVRPPKAGPWLRRNFSHLNDMTERLGLSLEMNKEITFAVADRLQLPRG